MAGLRDGDTPDSIAITFARCAQGMALARDLMLILPPSQWRSASVKMMNRDLLAENQDRFWRSVVAMRDRRLRRVPSTEMPSNSTKVTAGHMLAMAAHAMEHDEMGLEMMLADLDDRSENERDTDPPEGGWTMADAHRRVMELSGGRCEADGLHDDDCPGQMQIHNVGDFVVHHRYTREFAKQLKIPAEFIDRPSNLIAVWNRYPTGCNGCHGKIHREVENARHLGLLFEKHDYPPGWAPPETVAYLKPDN